MLWGPLRLLLDSKAKLKIHGGPLQLHENTVRLQWIGADSKVKLKAPDDDELFEVEERSSQRPSIGYGCPRRSKP